MNDKLINTKTASLIEAFIQNPDSSLIIEGSEDTGAFELCDTLIAQVLGKTHANNILLLEPEEGKSIGVEKIRELKKSLVTAVGRDDGIARVALIKRAQTMTSEAQNSLLKLIEEPSKNTLILLLTDRAGLLLETVRSRCQIIKVLPLTKQQALDYGVKKGMTGEEATKAFLLSGGKTKHFVDILHGRNTQTTDSIAQAKLFIAAKPFERLAQQKQFTEGGSLANLLLGLGIIAEAGLHGTNKAGLNRWKNMLQLTRHCRSMLYNNTPAKLVYLHLATHL